MSAVIDLQKKENIERLEDELKKHEQIEIPLDHFFAKGIYMRQMNCPKDTLLTGKIHKHDHLCVLLQGEVSVVDVTGESQRISAPKTWLSKAGAKRAIYCHTDVIWATVHATAGITDEQDPEKLESLLVSDSYREYEYERLLMDLGESHESMRAISENEDDQMPMPEGFDVEVKDSLIEGKGLFVTRPFQEGELLHPILEGNPWKMPLSHRIYSR